MTLGEKIKKARLDRHMTQREVVDGYITRNMLSKIENNSATPSMKTMEYLANQLGLPMSYFVTDVEIEVVPQAMQLARQAYAGGDAEKALAILTESRDTPSDESLMLLARCHLKLGEEASLRNDPEQALYHAEAALEANGQTVYASPLVEAGASLLEARFSQGLFDDAMKRYRSAVAQMGLERQYHLTMAQWYLSVGHIEDAARELNSVSSSGDRQTADYVCLQGELSLKGKDYDAAAKQLRRAEQLAITAGGSEDMLSPLYAMLEECYRELEDYKEAYRYASKQIQR